METRVSAPDEIASGTIYSSYLILLPPQAKPELQSSLLAKIETLLLKYIDNLSSFSIGVGPNVRG